MRLLFTLGIPLSWCIATTAVACPKVGQLPDFNCDGQATIVVLGDSLVSGIGDTKNKGGYVLRAQTAFPEANVVNGGTPGIRTLALLKKVSKAFKNTESSLRSSLLEADLVILDLGRNDRWLFGLPSEALRNLKRIRSTIEKNVSDSTGHAPLVVLSVLMLPNRGSQGPWVRELNTLIAKSSSLKGPADLRFDKVSKRLLSFDNIHPSPKGYDALAAVLKKYLLNQYPKLTGALRVDSDDDGLYDIYEAEKFGTDPTNPDTDGDSIKDGQDESPVG